MDAYWLVDHVRVWDIPVELLCRNHLLGEHREIHAIWKILTENKKGYSHHPETLRWKGKLLALYERHQSIAIEIGNRGYRHYSMLDKSWATGQAKQTEFVDTPARQRIILKGKRCACKI